MLTALSKLLMFSACAVLVLPVGWCCVAPTEAEAAEPARCPACAEAGPTGAGRTGDSTSREHGPRGDCECRLTAEIAAVTARVDISPGEMLPALLLDRPAAPVSPASEAASLTLDSGHPLQHLKSVVLRL